MAREFGRWNSDSEHKLKDWELHKADHTRHHTGVSGPGVLAEEDHDTLKYNAGLV